MRKSLIGLLTAIFLSFPVYAQTPVVPAQFTNFYAGGVSWNIGATPAVAGTGLYAHAITSTSGTYAFTVIDALPNTLKPFTVNTNIGAGIAQKIFTFDKTINVYMPTSAGISFNGGNTGWQWNGGVIAAIPVKQWYVCPTFRFLKSSVTNGTGYQPIIGVLIGGSF